MKLIVIDSRFRLINSVALQIGISRILSNNIIHFDKYNFKLYLLFSKTLMSNVEHHLDAKYIV